MRVRVLLRLVPSLLTSLFPLCVRRVQMAAALPNPDQVHLVGKDKSRTPVNRALAIARSHLVKVELENNPGESEIPMPAHDAVGIRIAVKIIEGRLPVDKDIHPIVGYMSLHDSGDPPFVLVRREEYAAMKAFWDAGHKAAAAAAAVAGQKAPAAGAAAAAVSQHAGLPGAVDASKCLLCWRALVGPNQTDFCSAACAHLYR